MDLNLLRIYESENIFKKKRLGRNYDGGYTINLLNKKYDLLLSCGISDDISFETSFNKIYPNCKIEAFDGTIRRLPEKVDFINFNRKNIGKDNTKKTDNLINYLKNNENIFLKMDIEGSEYEWLSIVPEELLNKIDQLVMEIHYLCNDDNKWKLLEKLNKTHYLTHIHGNNCRPNLARNIIYIHPYNENKIIIDISKFKDKNYYCEDNNITINKLNENTLEIIKNNNFIEKIPIYFIEPYPIYIPEVFEITYINKKFLDNPDFNNVPFPHRLDQPCNRKRVDHKLNTFPYIKKKTKIQLHFEKITSKVKMLNNRIDFDKKNDIVIIESNYQPNIYFIEKCKYYENLENEYFELMETKIVERTNNNMRIIRIYKNKHLKNYEYYFKIPKIIVSLTTIDSRVKEIKTTIDSIENQTLKPDEIRLYLGKKPYGIDKGITRKMVPIKLRKYIKWTDNIGPYTKILPCLKQEWNKDVIIITVDDDIIYHPEMIKILIDEYKKYGCLISGRYRQLTFKENNIYEYIKNKINTDIDNQIRKPLNNNFKIALGVSGVLYHPIFFNNLIFKGYNEYSPLADDLWLSFIRIVSGTPIIIPNRLKKYKTLENKIGLFKINRSDKNTEKLKNIYKFLTSEGLFKLDNLL